MKQIGLGRILRDARRGADVSQRQLAIRTGIAAPAISRIENGHESPSFERFSALMTALGFEPDVELRPLTGSEADPVHLAAEAELTPSQRLESLFEWMKFGDGLSRAELHPLAVNVHGHVRNTRDVDVLIECVSAPSASTT